MNYVQQFRNITCGIYAKYHFTNHIHYTNHAITYTNMHLVSRPLWLLEFHNGSILNTGHKRNYLVQVMNKFCCVTLHLFVTSIVYLIRLTETIVEKREVEINFTVKVKNIVQWRNSCCLC